MSRWQFILDFTSCQTERRIRSFRSGSDTEVRGILGFALLFMVAGVMGMATSAYSEELSQAEMAPLSGESALTDTIGTTGLRAQPASPAAHTGGASRRSYLRRETPFFYNPGGRRDPFRPLISEVRRGETIVTDLLRLDGAVLTGVVWSTGEFLAMVRDKDGRNFFLREGDAVFRGKVVSVTQTKAVFQLVDFGEVERVTLTVRANEQRKGSK